ncbi:hypothetical protein CC1G_12622 [Coprinopsis cinerea okayama7|uniref:Uncharacterized protein n=1 Tax=Coprinopsis cinerea (strain Okayama-7 / 130 / ATCC MYA-4618 / FGSC 9003) TaxID=240176 RepID=A8P8L0_COPC7|nr:hypothetical protein CC1G_12622 [Coprinopsis cinerea okayama7\|eukprot:XP_001839594.1 hypothetical protein CC1G_12622 [Coprinopsis cinerea okayama7\
MSDIRSMLVWIFWYPELPSGRENNNAIRTRLLISLVLSFIVILCNIPLILALPHITILCIFTLIFDIGVLSELNKETSPEEASFLSNTLSSASGPFSSGIFGNRRKASIAAWVLSILWSAVAVNVVWFGVQMILHPSMALFLITTIVGIETIANLGQAMALRGAGVLLWRAQYQQGYLAL